MPALSQIGPSLCDDCMYLYLCWRSLHTHDYQFFIGPGNKIRTMMATNNTRSLNTPTSTNGVEYSI